MRMISFAIGTRRKTIKFVKSKKIPERVDLIGHPRGIGLRIPQGRQIHTDRHRKIFQGIIPRSLLR